MNLHSFIRFVYHKFHLQKPYAFVRFLFTPYGHLRNFILFPIGAFFRKRGFCSSKDKEILKLKDRHLGGKVFVVCTGPSLIESDIQMIKNEYTISVNSIFKMYDRIDWKPSYYMFLELDGFDRYMNHSTLSLDGMAEEFTIINSLRSKLANSPKILSLHYNWLDHWDFYGSTRFRYSSDLLYGMYDFYSTGHAAIMLAMYMGFKDIYLLGADNNYVGEKTHFADWNCPGLPDAYTTEKAKNDIGLKMQRMMTLGYEQLAIISKKMGVNIYNSTRGGCVEAFPRVSLEDALNR